MEAAASDCIRLRPVRMSGGYKHQPFLMPLNDFVALTVMMWSLGQRRHLLWHFSHWSSVLRLFAFWRRSTRRYPSFLAALPTSAPCPRNHWGVLPCTVRFAAYAAHIALSSSTSLLHAACRPRGCTSHAHQGYTGACCRATYAAGMKSSGGGCSVHTLAPCFSQPALPCPRRNGETAVAA